MNSRAQFFIMFAVIFGLLLLSAVGRFNFATSTSKNLVLEFQRTCKNYKHEVFVISKNYTLGAIDNELEEIRNFTDFFIKQKGVEIFFAYGNTTNLILQNNFTEQVNFTINDNENVIILPNKDANLQNVHNITIVSPINKFFNITEHKNFYSILRIERNEETYYC
ncbi:MAG: hypothetical protein QXW65_00800 [Candidatus Pacearchaeota archaeon]